MFRWLIRRVTVRTFLGEHYEAIVLFNTIQLLSKCSCRNKFLIDLSLIKQIHRRAR